MMLIVNIHMWVYSLVGNELGGKVVHCSEAWQHKTLVNPLILQNRFHLNRIFICHFNALLTYIYVFGQYNPLINLINCNPSFSLHLCCVS